MFYCNIFDGLKFVLLNVIYLFMKGQFEQLSQNANIGTTGSTIDEVELWTIAVGGVKRGRIFGMGNQAKNLLYSSSSSRNGVLRMSELEAVRLEQQNELQMVKGVLRTLVQGLMTTNPQAVPPSLISMLDGHPQQVPTGNEQDAIQQLQDDQGHQDMMF